MRAAFAALSSFLLCAPAAAQALPADAIERIDSFLQQVYDAADLPGLSAVVVTPSGPAYVWTRGVADRRTGRPVTPDTPFEIASLTKSMTALALLQLHDDGLLELTDPVTKHLPEFRVANRSADSITLEMLLSHSSGLSMASHGVVWRDFARLDGSIGETVGEMRAVEVGVPGASYAYANLGYTVAAAVIERVTGEPWDAFVERRVLEPLGMRDAAVSLERRAELPVAQPYGARFGVWEYPVRTTSVAMAPAGSGPVASIMDFGEYLRAWLVPGSTPVVGDRGAAEAFRGRIDTVPGERYGLGWIEASHGGVPLVYHTGGAEGSRTFMSVVPHERVAVALFANGTGLDPKRVGLVLTGLALGQDAAPAPVHATRGMGLVLLGLTLVPLALVGVLGLRTRRAFTGRVPRRRRITHALRLLPALALTCAIWLLIPSLLRSIGMPLPFGVYGYMIDMLSAAVLLMLASALWSVYFAGRLVHDERRRRAGATPRAAAAPSAA